MTTTVAAPAPAPDPGFAGESPADRASRFRLAGLLAVAGLLHFVVPAFYERLIPRWLGNPRAWVFGSGVAELACAALLVPAQTRKAGAWAALVLLVLVYPGNVKMALDAGSPRNAQAAAAWLRLPLQAPLWRWAYRHTR